MNPRVIGEGSYGCVHAPALQCLDLSKNKIANNKFKDPVSKIMEDHEARQEEMEYNTIDAFDKTQQYYLGKPIKCKVSVSDDTKNALKRCKSMSTQKINLEHYYLLLMENGGMNLIDYCDDLVAKKHSKLVMKREIEYFFIALHNIFNGLLMFKKNGIVHHDLKAQNIVYNSSTREMKFIDFGMMVTSNELKSQMASDGFYDSHHWSFPPEIIHANKKRYTQNNSFKLSDDNRFIKTILSIVLYNKNVSRTKQSVINDYINGMNNIYPYDEFCDSFIDTFDTYGLGVGLMCVLKILYNDMDKKLFDLLDPFCYNLCNQDQYNRPNITTAIHEYEHILNISGITKTHNIHFDKNHKIQPNSIHSMTIDLTKITPLSKKELDKIVKTDAVKRIKHCLSNQDLNPNTNRCVKKCLNGYSRNAKTFKCIKSKVPKSRKHCLSNQDLNPNTNRCVKKCLNGYSRDVKTFKCKKK